MTDEERQQAADAWNTWRPGKSGRKSRSPFAKPYPIVRDDMGRPLDADGFIDNALLIEEVNAGLWPQKGNQL